MLKDPDKYTLSSSIIETNEKRQQFRSSHFKASDVVLFHKVDEKIVLWQDNVHLKKNQFSVEKPENVNRTTVVSPFKVVEIVWGKGSN